MDKNRIYSIAVIEDDPITQFIVDKLIKSIDRELKIFSFENGLEAMEYFYENTNKPELLPDIIFLDINMPIMDGWQFLDKFNSIKAIINKNIIIYLLTSSLNPDDLIQSKNYEVKDYLVKPLNVKLIQTIFSNYTICKTDS